jgi:hypothetical protein
MTMTTTTRRRRSGLEGATPLSHRRKWQTITVATVLLVPGFWSLLAGLVATATESTGGPDPVAATALGFAVLPFVYIVLAVLSSHPRIPGAVLRAMGLTLLVGIPVSALAADAVTGMVAGIGAGGLVALRADLAHSLRTRAAAVALSALYAFVLVRAAGPVMLLTAPVLPFTAIGLADHVAELRLARDTR